MIRYQIKDWNSMFETSRSRAIDHCGYVCLPNKQGGMGFVHILAEPDGAAIFGIFCLLAEACSKQCRPRAGWLTVDGHPDGRPWAVAELALRWRRDPSEIDRALQILSSQSVGWLLADGRQSNGTPTAPQRQEADTLTDRQTDRQTDGDASQKPGPAIRQEPGPQESAAEKRARADRERSKRIREYKRSNEKATETVAAKGSSHA